MGEIPEIKLYGADGCHKTQYYNLFLDARHLPHTFLDVGADKGHAIELRKLYKSGKPHFPTITIGKKKLRNPSKDELNKWINKLIPSVLEIAHDTENNRFTMDINGQTALVEYSLKNGIMYLNYSEVPHNLRGGGIGKVLVEKAFEKLTDEGYSAVAVCSFIKAVAARSKKWNSIIQ